MDCFVGATTGALKAINLRENTFTNLTPVKDLLPKRDEITSLTWNNNEQISVLAAQVDRQLKLFDGETSQQKSLFTIEGGTGPVKGLHLTESDNIVSCVESGVVKIWSREGKELKEWKANPGVTCMHGSHERKEIVTGGNDHLLRTWDIESGKQTWSARNVALDFLQLSVPIKVTDVRFVPGQTTIVEATKLHEMRLYDTRAQRRPIRKMPFLDAPLTAVSLCSREHHVIAANAVGEMGLFDIRSKVHPVCKYKGQAGSIRSIDGHPTEPYVATCGIDRFVRVHHIDTKKLVHKIYCKTRMNKIIIRKDLSILAKPKEEDEWDQIKEEGESDLSDDDEAESDDDEISGDSDSDVWEELETVKKQRKRKDTDEEEVPEPAKRMKVLKGKKRKEHEEIKEEITLSDDEEEPKKKSRKEEKPAAKSVKNKKVKEVVEQSEEDSDEEDVEPKKKPRLAAKKANGTSVSKSTKKKGKTVEAEVKEEVLSDEDVEPVPAKKRKISKKSKK